MCKDQVITCLNYKSPKNSSFSLNKSLSSSNTSCSTSALNTSNSSQTQQNQLILQPQTSSTIQRSSNNIGLSLFNGNNNNNINNSIKSNSSTMSSSSNSRPKSMDITKYFQVFFRIYFICVIFYEKKKQNIFISKK
jgi:hypothetical protein